MNFKRTSLMLIAVLIMFLPAMAFAETTECTVIDSLPSVITQQGVYCLKGNLATSATAGNAIDIQTNNVTIDFNGFKLGNLGGGPNTEMNGVYAYEMKNIVLTNANIRGFKYGVNLNGGSGHKVVNSNFDGNFYQSIYVRGQAIVEGNTISETGGRENESAFGVNIVFSDNSVVRNNKIYNLTPSGSFSYGIYITGSNNVVEDNLIDTNETLGKTSFGVYAYSGTPGDGRHVLAGNIVTDTQNSIYANGPYCVVKNNVIDNSQNAYYESQAGLIIDAGGNYPEVP